MFVALKAKDKIRLSLEVFEMSLQEYCESVVPAIPFKEQESSKRIAPFGEQISK